MQTKQLLPRLKLLLSSISLGLLIMLLALIGSISLNLAIAHSAYPQPQAILTLGGGENRETFTAQFATTYPDLPIWVSTGIASHKAKPLFQTAEISLDRLYLDYRAVDTVTNFTSLVYDFQVQEIHHVYLITSDFHMRRARAIAFFVFGSRGILTTPVSIPSSHPPETILHVSRDIGRSLLWIATGHTGASLNPKLRNRTELAQQPTPINADTAILNRL